jgi:hypothetical protein
MQLFQGCNPGSIPGGRKPQAQKAAQKTFKEFRAPLAQLDSAPAF